jgi:hypothetical protein
MAGDNLYVTQDRISVKFDTLEPGPALFAFLSSKKNLKHECLVQNTR